MQYTKLIGILLVIVGLIFSFVLYSFYNGVIEANETSCGCAPDECPMARGPPIEIYLGAVGVLVLGLVGIFLVLKTDSVEREVLKNEKELNKKIKLLEGDEKGVYERIFKSDGIIFQSDLVEQSNLPKAKVSRILDKLEGRSLVERKRHGLSNLVLLKK